MVRNVTERTYIVHAKKTRDVEKKALPVGLKLQIMSVNNCNFDLP